LVTGPDGGLTPEQAGRLTIGRNVTLTLAGIHLSRFPDRCLTPKQTGRLLVVIRITLTLTLAGIQWTQPQQLARGARAYQSARKNQESREAY
jgi:hypothetical protein